MKGLGNYRFQRGPAAQNIERRLGVLLMYRGPKAVVRFHDGSTYAIPAAPLKKIGVVPEERFRMIVVREGGEVREVRVERLAAARPPRVGQAMPKVQMRDGRKLTTRK